MTTYAPTNAPAQTTTKGIKEPKESKKKPEKASTDVIYRECLQALELGLSIASVARRHNISRQRASMIVAKRGPPPIKQERAKLYEQISRALIPLLKKGLPRSQLADAIDESEATVYSVLTSGYRANRTGRGLPWKLKLGKVLAQTRKKRLQLSHLPR